MHAPLDSIVFKSSHSDACTHRIPCRAMLLPRVLASPIFHLIHSIIDALARHGIHAHARHPLPDFEDCFNLFVHLCGRLVVRLFRIDCACPFFA